VRMATPVKSDAQQRRPRRSKRTYNVRLIKRDYPYLLSEIADLFGLHRNAVRRWIKAGLPTIDNGRPQLVHGSEAIDFLCAWQTRRKRKCAADEFYCFRCRCTRRPLLKRVEIEIRGGRKLNLSGLCETCGTRMNRAGSVEKIEKYRQIFAIQTPSEGRITGCSGAPVMCHLHKDGIDAALQSKE
jgi:hypothetical protein